MSSFWLKNGTCKWSRNNILSTFAVAVVVVEVDVVLTDDWSPMEDGLRALGVLNDNDSWSSNDMNLKRESDTTGS